MSMVPSTVAFPEAVPATRKGKDWVVASDGVEVKLTNLGKPFWGPEGYTKGDLLTFYWNIAPWILPYLKGRPLTLKRMPNGADGDFFYAKQAPPGTPRWLRTAPVVSADSDKRINYLLADDRAALLWLANAGCIELHPWHSRVDRLANPDYAFFDLDPMGAATFEEVREVALLVRTVLEGLGLRGYPRTSGATGMQVYVPVERVHTASGIREWVGAACALINRADPERTTMEWDIARRGDRVFLDHNMNTEGKNIAATYCLRPERAAPVATPLEWDEVEGGIVPADFTIATIWERLAGRPDLFAPVLQGGQDLVGARRALGLPPEPGGGGRHVVLAAAPPGELRTYAAKRDFAATPEPAPEAAPSPPTAAAPREQTPPAPGGARFVIQHHLATRLHHDLRLEEGGTARSWALPKGLPEVPDLRHLAVQTEDHPLAYLDFSGTIPEGEYGAGEMRIWDRGTYEAVEWHEGKVTVRLAGQRHTGEYHLFRTSRDDPSQWMITRAAPAAAPVERPPAFTPMLAASVETAFDDAGWVFEVKWDGVRAIAEVERPGFGAEGHARFTSRLGNDLTPAYPELAALWERVLAFNAVLDGEIVAMGEDGRPSFQLLQQRMHLRDTTAVDRARRRSPVSYIVFDVLAADGRPLVDLALDDRLAVLDDLLVPGGPVVRSQAVPGEGRALYDAVTGQGLEGIVAKKRTSRYLPGRRSPEWRKIKVRRRARAVIGGWLPGEGSRAGTLGALLVGFVDPDGRLQYSGRVGTGFDDAELARLQRVLREHATDAPPFADLRRLPPEARPRRGRARWCTPDLVCSVEFAEQTDGGRLRAPAYKGLCPGVDPATAVSPAG